MNLELMAMQFLRFEKACPVALYERSPRWGFGRPDVLGITKARFLLEIEIKRSYSDFRANEKKPHIRDRTANKFLEEVDPRWPKQFWYLVPPELVKKVEPWVPAWAGLMRGPSKNEIQSVKVEKPAPRNNASLRLTSKEMLNLGHCMANQILSQARLIEDLKNRALEYYDPFFFSPEI